MARRFFIDESCVFGNKIELTGKEHVHLCKVLRAKIGEEIEITSNKFNYVCSIESINKQTTVCLIKSKQEICNNAPNVTLFQASMKGEHMDYAIQKATELNIKTFVPFLSQFVVAKIDDKKIERFRAISQEACKQSGRKSLMEISSVLSFNELKKELKSYDKIIFAYEKSSVNAQSELNNLKETEKIALVVGSEGGFSELEAQELTKIGAKPISLGENILRGETASLVLTSIVMFKLNQFKKI